jgi:hypothetical protein
MPEEIFFGRHASWPKDQTTEKVIDQKGKIKG